MSAPDELLRALGYRLSVAVDLTGATRPSGAGDRPHEVPGLDEALRELLDAAEAGAEYACIEITRTAARPVEDVPLPLADSDAEPQADSAAQRAAMADWNRYWDGVDAP